MLKQVHVMSIFFLGNYPYLVDTDLSKIFGLKKLSLVEFCEKNEVVTVFWHVENLSIGISKKNLCTKYLVYKKRKPKNNIIYYII